MEENELNFYVQNNAYRYGFVICNDKFFHSIL